MPNKNKTNSGSFSALVSFSIMQPDLSIQSLIVWTKSWADKNIDWSRQWKRSDDIYTEMLFYTDSFRNAPCVILESIKESDGDIIEFIIRFDCTPNSPDWKDWISKFYNDIKSNYPSISRKKGIQIIS